MTTTTDYNRLRADISASEAALSDEVAEDIFVEAAEDYTDVKTIKAATRVIALQRLTAGFATTTTYIQNNTREEAGKIFDNWVKLLTIWEGRLAGAVADNEPSAGGAARFAGKRIKPARLKEYPDA
jgi:hypothetical protein